MSIIAFMWLFTLWVWVVIYVGCLLAIDFLLFTCWCWIVWLIVLIYFNSLFKLKLLFCLFGRVFVFDYIV